MSDIPLIKTFGNDNCKNCGNQFTKMGPTTKYCSEKCRTDYKNNYRKKWYEQNGREYRIKNKQRIADYNKKYSDRKHSLERMSDRLLQKEWGVTGRRDFKDAEIVAVNILSDEGYLNIKLVTSYMFQSPFDLIATKYGKKYAFQVTTRINTAKKNAHRLAHDLRLIHKTLFVSLTLEKYVIKDFSNGGFCNLTLHDLDKSKSYVEVA